MSRFQSNIIINYICRKISKIFLKPTAFWHILTLLKCALQYICPPPLWKLRINLSVDKLHPLYSFHTSQWAKFYTKKYYCIVISIYISHSPCHSHLCNEKSYFFPSKLFRFTHTVFKFRANFQRDILWNMICIWWIWICTFFRYSNTLHVVLCLLILNLENGKNNCFLASDGSRYLLTKISKPFFWYLKKFCIWQTS